MEEVVEKRKRIRKKTCEIDSIEKLKIGTSTNKEKPEKPEKVEKIKPEKDKSEDLNQSSVSFGKFNITIKKTTTMTPEELRNYYDKKFKIEDSEKTAKLMIQDEQESLVFEPMMEDESLNLVHNDSNTALNLLTKPVQKPKIERTNVHKILSKFIQGTKSTWPQTTDILCWWCSHSFDTMPLPCPVDYDGIREHYRVNGVFCSWSCIAAYSIKEYTSLAMVYQFRNELLENSGQKIDENIVIAPPKYCLKSFGGHMTIKDFRSLDKTKTILISTETLSYINQDIVEIKN